MQDDIMFGQRIKQHRKDLDLTQEDFAEQIGISTETISKIERGERRPSRQVAERMAQVLQLPAEERTAFVRAARVLLTESQEARVPAPVRPPATVLAEPAVVSAPQRPRANLPAPSTPLIGREADLAALIGLLNDTSCRLVTVSGPGGIGKTRLALEATARQAAAFAGEAAFVPLGSVSSPDLIAPAIADALGFHFYGQVDLDGQLLDFLREKSLLLLLDNFEHLIDGAEFLGQIYQRAPQIKLLVTSRERLNLQGEWVLELRGLPLPRSEQGAGFDQSDAVALFLQTARRARAGFTPDAADRAAIARICRLVEGMPLAIELAAAWVRVLPCAEIADEIARTIDFLAASARDLPVRHRSLRAVFDHSWNLLSEEERTILHMLSVFRGGFRREAAEWIAGATLPLLTSLVDKSLLRRSGAGRYDMHELVAQYAAANLAAAPAEYAATRDRHTDYYLTLVQRRENDLKRASQKAVVDELVTEIDNLRLAWDWAVTHARVADLRRAIRGFSWFYELRSWYQEGEAVLARSAQVLRGAGELGDMPPQQAILLGQVMTFEGWFHSRQGRYGPARAILQQAIALLRPLGDQTALADALTSLGMALNMMGEFQQARELLDEGLAIGRALGDNWVIILALGTLGMVAHGQGEYAESERLCREALAASLAIGSVRAVVFSISALSMTAFALEQYDELQALLRASFATSSAIGDYWGIGSALSQLGRVAYVQGEYAEAQYLFRESYATFRDIGDRWSMVRALTGMGDAFVAIGDRAEAWRTFRDAWRMADAAQATPVATEVLAGLADLLAHDGAVGAALDLTAHIFANPAASQHARARTSRLRAQLTAALDETQPAPARSLEQILEASFVAK